MNDHELPRKLNLGEIVYISITFHIQIYGIVINIFFIARQCEPAIRFLNRKVGQSVDFINFNE